ncbi:hypothetical protein M405DRAFT_178369 [Rhizopogon salebrosus TDB-379]|nr:hypothetical protein M405DRAFT_178369 [Rhizopogon salebrosus TDB-379]
MRRQKKLKGLDYCISSLSVGTFLVLLESPHFRSSFSAWHLAPTCGPKKQWYRLYYRFWHLLLPGHHPSVRSRQSFPDPRVAASGSHSQNVPSGGSILIPHTSIQASLSTTCKSPKLPLRWYLSCDENWSLEFYQHTHACLIASWCDRPDLFVTCSETMTCLCTQSMKTNSSHWQGLIMGRQESFRLRCIHGCPFCLR